MMNDNVCPYCGSESISASMPESDTNTLWCTADCAECKREWRWFYELKGVELLSENVDKLDENGSPQPPE